MRILWLSPYVPYDTVGHAGGQNHNYYIKYVKEKTNFDITLISVCEKNEIDKLDLDQYEISNIIKVYDRKEKASIFEDTIGKVMLLRDGGLLGNRKFNLIKSAIFEYAKSGLVPDVIITQWTEATLVYDTLMRFFPDSKYIAIEEDVAFLGYRRKYESAKGLYRIYKKIKYHCLKRAEIRTLSKYDLVIALNNKDKDLLLGAGISSGKLMRMCSYHGFFKGNLYNPDLNKLLFYGAMARPENYLSAIWFIENVMDKLDDSFILLIVGSNPPEQLLKYQSERIIITGFVDSVEEYFNQCLCLVAPLLLGAGTKIKVLEALSAGIPVVTNEIGAEGIGLQDGENYLHCESSEDYVSAVNLLRSDSELRTKLSHNGRIHVLEHFDADSSLNELINRIRTYEK